MFGPVLEIHDGHGYSTCYRGLPTGDVLKGRTLIGVYFSADWCPSCTEFTPLLDRYYQNWKGGNLLNNNCSLFQVVLVSRCKTIRDTHSFFEPMSWAALPHLKLMVERGQSLMTRFGITTIPALVLLDRNGNVVCLDGRRWVTSAPSGQSPAISKGLLPDPQVGPPLVRKPCGNPPTFVWGLPAGIADSEPSASCLPTGGPQSSPTGVPRQRRPAPPADIPQVAGSDDVTQPPTKQAKPWPPPKPNLIRSKGTVTFSLPPIRQLLGSHTRKPVGRGSPKMTYILTPAQVALRAGSTDSAPQEGTAEGGTHSKPPPPPSTDIQQGKPCSLMQPQPPADADPSTPVMKEWRHGINVNCGPDWSWDAIKAAVACRLHPTTCTPDAYALFNEDIAYQVKAGFSRVILWDDVKWLWPKNLKISPVVLIPQVGCCGRIILDLSFPVYQEVDRIVTATQKSVNDTTVLTAPSVPIKEISKVLPRLLQYLRDTPRGLHILFCKLDISNGFCRLVVHWKDCFNFAYVLPQEADKPIRLVILAAVQMGWVESPGLFCTVTESARDLTQHFVNTAVPLP
jgi:thiol-disulfide isomerase/thioredoxin